MVLLFMFAGLASVAVGYVAFAKLGTRLARARLAAECAAVEEKLDQGWEKLEGLPERVEKLWGDVTTLMDATCQQPPAQAPRRGSHA